MAFLDNVEQLRKVTFGAKYLWDIKFPDAPAPFDLWFPAIDVDEDAAHLDSYTFDTAQDVFKVPQSSTTLNLRITFHDDDEGTLFNWFKEWINTVILHDGEYVSTVDTSVRQLQLLKLNHRREITEGGNLSYWVYPEGTLTDTRDNSSDALIYTLNFVIVGKG